MILEKQYFRASKTTDKKKLNIKIFAHKLTNKK